MFLLPPVSPGQSGRRLCPDPRPPTLTAEEMTVHILAAQSAEFCKLQEGGSRLRARVAWGAPNSEAGPQVDHLLC